MIRSGNTPVPGCKAGGWQDLSNHNYCYGKNSLVTTTGLHSCTKSQPCPKCHGYCSNDDECAGVLQCSTRSGFANVHGCLSGGKHDIKNYNYCYDASALVYIGKNGCTKNKPCGKCYGHCDNDDACLGTLRSDVL